MNLRDLQEEHDNFDDIAQRWPESTADAMSLWLGERKQKLLSRLSRGTTFDAERSARQIQALDWIADLLLDKPVEAEGKLHRPNRKRGAKGQADRELAVLSETIAPVGWRETWGKALDLICTKITTAMVKLEDVETNQARLIEAQRLQKFLRRYEQVGFDARRRLSGTVSQEILNA